MRLRNVLLTSTALLALGAGAVSAGPDGPVVVGGSATVSGAGTSSTVINQNTNRAIINWNSFNIGSGETTLFQFNTAAGANSAVLNRVNIGNPSLIAAHESPRTTKLYDRTTDGLTLNEIERIAI